MADRQYRDNPLHSQLQVGDRIRRREVHGVPSRLSRRVGVITELPVMQKPGVYYVSVLWEGSNRPEPVHVGRILRLPAQEV